MTVASSRTAGRKPAIDGHRSRYFETKLVSKLGDQVNDSSGVDCTLCIHVEGKVNSLFFELQGNHIPHPSVGYHPPAFVRQQEEHNMGYRRMDKHVLQRYSGDGSTGGRSARSMNWKGSTARPFGPTSEDSKLTAIEQGKRISIKNDSTACSMSCCRTISGVEANGSSSSRTGKN